jgi:hypothetical protein
MVSQLGPNYFETHNPPHIHPNGPAGQNKQVASQVVRSYFVREWYQRAILDVFHFVPQSGGLTHPIPGVDCKPIESRWFANPAVSGPRRKVEFVHISRANPPSSFAVANE